MPERIQLRRTKGWQMPANTVVVARPTLWGNPFVGPDPAETVAAYRRHLAGEGPPDIREGGLQFAYGAHRQTLARDWSEWAQANRETLRGKNLACYCSPGALCHGDALLEWANAPLKCEAVP